MKKLLAVLCAIACAPVWVLPQEVVLPDGRRAYTTECSGAAECYKILGEYCPNGYTILTSERFYKETTRDSAVASQEDDEVWATGRSESETETIPQDTVVFRCQSAEVEQGMEPEPPPPTYSMEVRHYSE